METDPLGSTVGTLLADGGVATAVDYLPSGQAALSGQVKRAQTNDPFAFTGYERDPETGNDYASAFNLYGYVANNPLRFVDPMGLSTCTLQGIVSDCGTLQNNDGVQCTSNCFMSAINNGNLNDAADPLKMPHDGIITRSTAVSKPEIEAAEILASQEKFSAALALSQDMLQRAQDDETRMRLLFNIISCSTRLRLSEVTNEAIHGLGLLPDHEVTRLFADYLQAVAYLEFNQPQKALDLIDANLSSDLMRGEDSLDRKYEHLFHKGRALSLLARLHEALSAWDAARRACPNGKHETDMLIARSNCLMALHKYDEAFEVATQVLDRGDEDLATVALQYMAESRMWQGRVQESLTLYATLQKKLPSRFVQEERIQEGIRNGMAYLERLQSNAKTS